MILQNALVYTCLLYTSQGDGFHRQRRDAADGQLHTEPHLRGEKGDGVGQGLVGEPQPARRVERPVRHLSLIHI